MRPAPLTLIAVAALAAASAGTSAASPLSAPAGSEWVVGLEAGERGTALAAELRADGATVRAIPEIGILSIKGGERAQLIDTLRENRSRVGFLEPVLRRRLLAEPAEGTDERTGRSFAWAQATVGARSAVAAAGGGAPSAPVAVVDSGVDATHPDLVGRVRAGRAIAGGDQHIDEVGHGTFVAGLISAVDGNGNGGYGVGGSTPVVPIKISSTASVSSADLAAGIVAGVDAGARVINVSVGGPGLSGVERSALDYAASKDVLIVASAGNDGDDGNGISYPAAALGGDRGGWGQGLSVGATGPSGSAAPFSTHNRFVSLAAPGAGSGSCTDGVHSTIPFAAQMGAGGACDRSFTSQGAGRYAYAQGTSFSAPIVAGAAALVRQVRPQLTASQTADVLIRSARQTSGVGWNEFTGAGVVDMPAAIALAGRYDLTPPPSPSSSWRGRGPPGCR